MQSVRIDSLPRDQRMKVGGGEVILFGTERTSNFIYSFIFNPNFNMAVGSTINSVK